MAPRRGGLRRTLFLGWEVDSSGEVGAFAGACGLLTRQEGFIHGLEAERKTEQTERHQRRQQIAAIGGEIQMLRRKRRSLARNC